MHSKSAGLSISVGLGICFGTALGMALHNVGVGIALGVSLTTAFGLISGAASTEALARNKVVLKKPLPHPLGL